MDAFNEVLWKLSSRAHKTDANQLKDLGAVQKGYQKSAELFDRSLETLQQLECFESPFSSNFVSLRDSVSPQEWVTQLIEHHQRNQKRKPPNGKAPWIETFDDGSWMVRPHYRREDPNVGSIGYVNRYRTMSLLSFLNDLKLVKN